MNSLPEAWESSRGAVHWQHSNSALVPELQVPGVRARALKQRETRICLSPSAGFTQEQLLKNLSTAGTEFGKNAKAKFHRGGEW